MELPDSPVVSIGMPVLNCERTLPVTLRSIRNQTLREWELLVIDDGSDDSTVDQANAVKDPRIRVLADGLHEGLPARLNQAVHLSRGKYFARMDGDDVAFPQRLARQVAYLDAHPGVDLLAASVVVFQGQGKIIGQRIMRESHAWICRRPWASFPMPHPTWMGRMNWFRAHPYNPAAIRCEDQELLLRTYKQSRFAGMEEVLLGYREDRIALAKICRGRRNHVKALVRRFWAEGCYLRMFAAVLGHSARLIEDIVAVASGLNHRLLRQRATPAPAGVTQDWQSVWTLNDSSP
jgi:glycosyltransferase involved in cell wall biosynthesis